MEYKARVNRSTVRSLAAPALLVAATLATYVNTFRGDFQFDDAAAILENPHLESWRVFIEHLDHMVRPALYSTFLIDRSLYGDVAAGYHLLNLLLHLGCGLLIYRIAAHAAADERSPIPFWTALLFLIHPLNTETVTYISGRATGLMAFFYLLAFYCYIREAQVGALICLVLSFASKETAATFPVALLLWDGLVRQPDGAKLRAVMSRHWPFWAVVGIAGLWAVMNPRYHDLAQFSVTIRPLWDNLLSQVHAVSYVLILFFAPWKQNFDHDLPVFHSLFRWPLPFELAVMAGMAAMAILSARRFPLLAFGVGWFALQLVPTNSLLPRADLLSERNLYLASIGLFLTVAAVAVRAADRVAQPKLAAAGALVVALIVCGVTYQRNALYQDELLLWADTVRKSPEKARPHNNLGYAYATRGEWERALEEFRIAVKLDPDYGLARDNLRNAYLSIVER